MELNATEFVFLSPFLLGLVQLLKLYTGLAGRKGFVPSIAVMLGVAFGYAYGAAVGVPASEAIFTGLAAGMNAVGLYELGAKALGK